MKYLAIIDTDSGNITPLSVSNIKIVTPNLSNYGSYAQAYANPSINIELSLTVFNANVNEIYEIYEIIRHNILQNSGRALPRDHVSFSNSYNSKINNNVEVEVTEIPINNKLELF